MIDWSMVAFGVVPLSWGICMISAPVKVAKLLALLGRGRSADLIPHYNPQLVARSRRLRLHFRVGGTALVLLGSIFVFGGFGLV